MATQQSGLVSGNSQNAPGGSTHQSRSKFPESYSQFQTERFAEYVPFFVMEAVSGDRLPLHSNHEVQTYNLKSPILQSLSKKKDYFAVPMQAILPLNWEKFYTNPNIGQDVPDDVGLGVADFWSKMKTLFTDSLNELTTRIADSGATAKGILQDCLKFFIFFENFYSAGSLMETLGISGHNWMRIYNNTDGEKTNFDAVFDVFCEHVDFMLSTSPSYHFAFTLGGRQYNVYSDSISSSSTYALSLREALELMRDDLSFTVDNVYGTNWSTFVATMSNFFQDLDFSYMPNSDAPLNLGRLWAYQLVVFHFYSNDHIDFLYSAELYRQYIRQLHTHVSQVSGADAVPKFSVNGFEYLYDALSAKIFNNLVAGWSTQGIFSYSTGVGQANTANDAFAYIVSLFSFKRSLRFMDYFTGSRSLPLAVGDHEVAVNAQNKVDIIDLAQSSMMTKFLQAVNRSGRKFSNYMKELFGKTPAYDYHNPMYLAHTSDLVGAQETENTGSAQVDPSRPIAVTSRLKATSSRYAFEFQPDRDSIVIGITYYDLPRVYTRATERQNFIIDRFDMFNPYMQFIGDQDIYQAEIGTDTPVVTPGSAFSYTNRHMEYKQRFNQASGGFLVPSTGLDHWIFSADEKRRNFLTHISPSFIRSFNSEIDKFYQGLTGYSLGTYFHFIVRYDNRMDASRPMAYNPIISV